MHAASGRWDTQSARSEQNYSGWHDDDRAPPPPPPPPGYSRAERIQERGLSQSLIFALIGGSVLLALFWGWTSSGKPEQKYAPYSEASASLPASSQPKLIREGLPPAAFSQLPSSVDGKPIGLNKKYRHPWCYDGNGRLYVLVEGSWYKVKRTSATMKEVRFTLTTESAKRSDNLPAYIWTVPDGYPVQELDLTNQSQMALLFGQNAELTKQWRLLDGSVQEQAKK